MPDFQQTANARRVRTIVREHVARGNTSRLLEQLETVTENIYQQLPSGDYGRGDVRRIIEEELGCNHE